MMSNFFMLGFVMLLSAMLPGPDFAMVTKNTLLHSRKAGIYTSLGIGVAVLVHMTYCVLGFAAVIRESPVIFHSIQYIGAAYLAYLGCRLIKAKPPKPIETQLVQTEMTETSPQKSYDLSGGTAFRQGFICNLFNPKATLFFLTLFSLIITAQTPLWISLTYGVEMFSIAVLWFCLLACLLSHSTMASFLNKIRNSMEKILGIGLIGIAAAMILFS